MAVPLRAVAEVTLGRMRSPGTEHGPRQVPYLRAANVGDGELKLDDVKTMHFEPAEERRYGLALGDVLVTEASGSRSSVGQTALWTGEVEQVMFQNTLLRLRPRPGTDPRFLYWWSRHAHGSGLYARAAQGLAIWHLSAERLRAATFPELSPAEQNSIARFLDEQVPILDHIISKRSHQISLINEGALSQLSHLLTPSDGDCDALPTPRLGYICRLQSGVTLDEKRGGDHEYPYLRVANVQDGFLDLSEVKTVRLDAKLAMRSLLHAGDVLMTEGGDLDKLGRGTVWAGQLDGCVHQNHIFALRPRPELLLPEYLAAMTRTHYARGYFESTGTRSTNLASTNSSKIMSFRLPLPSTVRQREILGVLSAIETQRRQAVSLAHRQTNLVRERKQAIITGAVTGQFDVTTARSVS